VMHERDQTNGAMNGSDNNTANSMQSEQPQKGEGLRRYHTPKYWDARYSRSSFEYFDWYTDYQTLKPLMDYYLKRRPNASVLNVGCGNSRLSMDMALDGYSNITSIDISKNCVDRMRKICNESKDSCDGQFSDLRWLEMDATDLKFGEEKFDLVVDKGTLDALICETTESHPKIQQVVAEAWRVLKSGGYYILITYANEQHRMKSLSRLNWHEVKARRVPYSPSALLIRRLRAQLDGKPLSCVTEEMMSAALPEVRKDLDSFDTATEDLGPEKSVFCYAYCCRKRLKTTASATVP